jgi:hypothetical protein
MPKTGAVEDAALLATLSVEGRSCPARPLRGSALGSVSGLVAVAESERDLREAVTWMPGRILVLGGSALARPTLRSLLTTTEITTFGGIVVLADEATDLDPLGSAPAAIPMVTVSGPIDQDRIRRAVRVTLTVDTRPSVVAPIPTPRHHRRRRVSAPVSLGAPGTVDLRLRRG